MKQAAEALSISEGYIYRLCRAKKLPHKRIGGRVLIPVKALEEFMETPDDEGDEEYESWTGIL